jgi:hypothetical protein
LSLLRSLKHPTRALSPSRHLTVTETHNETHKHTTRALSPSRSVFLSRTPHPLALWLVLGLELAGCGVKAKEESGDEETRRREGGCWWRVLVGATGSSLATGSSHGMWRQLSWHVAGAGGVDMQLSVCAWHTPSCCPAGGGRQAGGVMVGEATRRACCSRCM